MNVGDCILRQSVFGTIMHEKSIGLRKRRYRRGEKQKNREYYFQHFFHTNRKMIGQTTSSRVITITVKIYSTKPKKRFEQVQVYMHKYTIICFFFPIISNI